MAVSVPASVVPAWLSPAMALVAAVGWGGGDFAGGMGVKATGGSVAGALRVVLAAHALSLLVLLTLVRAMHGSVPSGAPLYWGLAGGVAAGLSLTAFYVALSRGAMGASAAISGLLAAAIPTAVSLWLEGRPSLLRLFGFALAAVAIWLVASSAPEQSVARRGSRGTLWLALGSGVGFGVYFVSLRLANSLGVVEPMALARVGSTFTCVVLLGMLELRSSPYAASGASTTSAYKGGPWLSRTALLWAVGVAVLDTGANLLFVAATRSGRLDVSAVLASLYPASTILLAAGLLRERPTRRQMVGMMVAICAVVMISV